MSCIRSHISAVSRQRKILFILLGSLIVVAGAIFWARSDPEPSYDNRSISEWYDVMRQAEAGSRPLSDSDKAKTAIREIGTNSIPYLLQLVRYTAPPTPRWKKRAQGLPVIGKWFARMPIEPAAQRARMAVPIFFILGSNAAPAIPELARLLNGTNDPGVADRALRALSGIGDASVPTFLAIIGDRQHPHCIRAVLWVRMIDPDKISPGWAALLPHLIRFSQDADPYIAKLSIIAIGRLALQPEISVPVLINVFQRATNRSMRAHAVFALSHFGKQASNAIPALRLALNDPNEEVRTRATNALQQIIDPPAGGRSKKFLWMD